MQLDFSKFDKLFSTNTEAAPAEQQETESGGLQRKADERKHEIDEAARVYREYQRNIKASAQLQAEIYKGVNAGADIKPLFLKACEAIALMTANTAFYSHIEEGTRAVCSQQQRKHAPFSDSGGTDYRAIYRAVCNFHEKYNPPRLTADYWTQAAEDVIATAQSLGNNRLAMQMLGAVYEELEREYKALLDAQKGA